MEIAAGFLLALIIGLTGLGGGTLTMPVLTLMGLPVGAAVATALTFTAAVKLLAAPVYLWRRQVDGRVLAWLLLGGMPGVVAGTFLLQSLNKESLEGPVLVVVGLIVVSASFVALTKSRHVAEHTGGTDRPRLLPWLAAPIGLEVGFSSVGAGALGTLVLMRLTKLQAAKIVGTDLLFGLGLSLAGGGLHLALGGVQLDTLAKLLAGGLPGALLGAKLAGTVPSRPLRTGLCVWLMALGTQLVWRGAAALAR